MTAVFKRELNSYLNGMVGWVFMAMLFLVFGIYTAVLCLTRGFADFSLVPFNALFTYLIVIPLLTMRSLAEEKRQRTDQLLYASTLGTGEVILGKYLAMLTILAIPTAVCLIYPAVLSTRGRVPLATAYSSLVAFFFLGAALLAIGLFFSSVSQSQIVSAALTFGVLLICYFAGDLKPVVAGRRIFSFLFFVALFIILGVIAGILTKNRIAGIAVFAVPLLLVLVMFLARPQMMDGSAVAVLDSLALFSRVETFCDGIFDIGTLLFYASVAFLFLFFSAQAFEKRRWN